MRLPSRPLPPSPPNPATPLLDTPTGGTAALSAGAKELTPGRASQGTTRRGAGGGAGRAAQNESIIRGLRLEHIVENGGEEALGSSKKL